MLLHNEHFIVSFQSLKAIPQSTQRTPRSYILLEDLLQLALSRVGIAYHNEFPAVDTFLTREKALGVKIPKVLLQSTKAQLKQNPQA